MNQITIMFGCVALLTGVVAIILFIVFRIPHLFLFLTGIGARREIKRIERGELQTYTPAARISFFETTILSERDKNETVVLSAEDIIDGIAFKRSAAPKLRVKKEIVIKDGMKEEKGL